MKSLLYAATTMLLAACLVGGGCKPASETPVLEGLSLAESEIELAVGELRSLEVVVTPPDAQGYTLSWESSDETVASVSDEGEVSALAPGTAAVTVSSGEISATCQVTVSRTYESVDLGLSVKWAAYNVGAENPWEYGDYFAYGETEPKDEYTMENCLTYEKSIPDLAGNPEYDAATANWGDGWRLPMKSEIQELIDNCEWEWTELEGVSGYNVTGPSGNSIFLPAAGYRSGTSASDNGRYGYYWACDPDALTTMGSYLSFSGFSKRVDPLGRHFGISIRPVSE